MAAYYNFVNDNTCIRENRPVASWSGSVVETTCVVGASCYSSTSSSVVIHRRSAPRHAECVVIVGGFVWPGGDAVWTLCFVSCWLADGSLWACFRYALSFNHTRARYLTANCSDDAPVAQTVISAIQVLTDGSYCARFSTAIAGAAASVSYQKFSVSCFGADESDMTGSTQAEGVYLRGINCTSTADCSVTDDRGCVHCLVVGD